MIANDSDSDDDKYIPSGLLNSANQTFRKTDIKKNEISEFYNAAKPINTGSEQKSSSSVIFDLSSKSSISVKPHSEKFAPNIRSRVLSIPPGPRRQFIPSPSVHSSTRLPLPGVSQRMINVQQMIHPAAYQPLPVPVRPIIQVRPVFYPSRPHPYTPPGFVPLNIHTHPQTYAHYVPTPRHLNIQPQISHPPKVHPSKIHAQSIVHQTIPSSHNGHMAAIHPPAYMASNFLTSTVVPISSIERSLSSGTMATPSGASLMPLSQGVPHINQLPQIIQPIPSPGTGTISSAVRKKRTEETISRTKEDNELNRSALKAKKLAERTGSRNMKKIKMKKDRESIIKKETSFAKDMFVIRLKDVDSFDRNNEIWRIDNHILIQKFCGVPSLRAPARQFQSTNKMSGYDSRARWRFFIIDPVHVEIDKYGSEITVHKFPSIGVLRDAKKLAEIKDEEFKDVEKCEFEEKMNQFEAKQISKTVEKQKRSIERKQRRLGDKEEESSSKNLTEGNLDEDVCRNIMNGLLDALEDEDYDEEDSLSSTDDEITCSDEEDDAGSLITLAHSTYSDDDDNVFFYDTLYGEHEVPEVALELTVD